MRHKVSILLSVYNGENYLEEQLLSLVNQDYSNIQIYIRDDGSSDGSSKIIYDYSKRYNFIHVLESKDNLGCAESFLFLLEQVESDYYFFCDQDDFWLPNKVRDTLSQFCGDKPTLVHSDLRIVSESLEQINESFYSYQSINCEIASEKKRIIVQNYIVGCTVAINKKLRDLCVSIEFDHSKVAMHDWWMALIAIFFGKVIYLNKKTILYRQHDKNVLGAPNNTMRRYMHSFISGVGKNRVLNFTEKVSGQASLFISIYGKFLSKEDMEILRLGSSFNCKLGFFNMMTLMFKHRVFLQGLKRNLAILYVSVVS
ncbi:glycosyltransferase family 2 protein [Aeromonas hydrophila]|uniref:glycosyltransferase family 2 protein n=1 Tax=Aeromonas hydrophila TaxID=644 RepID=UPI0024436835|nr:glycosyltransferase family 2 protein [Aeromonas hydrophila]